MGGNNRTLQHALADRARRGHDIDMDSEAPIARIELRRADAVVLFDWLMSTDLDAVPFTHPAQRHAFTHLCDELESQTDVLSASIEEVAVAQQEVAENSAR